MALLTSLAGSYVPTSAITTLLRESLFDTVTNIDPTATPIMDMFPSMGTIDSPIYQWPVDSLPSLVLDNTTGSVDVDGINVQGITEGFDSPNFATAYPYTGQPQRLTNFIQMFAAKVGISDTLKRSRVTGVRDPYNWEVIKATRVIKKARERRLFDNISANASWVTGTSGDPRRMYSLFAWVATIAPATALMPQTTANGTLTPALIDAAMETAVVGSTGAAGGGQPNLLALSLGVKFDVSAQLRSLGGAGALGTSLQAINVSNINAQEKRVIRNIDVYEGDAGELTMAWSRQIPQSNVTTGGGKAWLLQTDMIQLGDYSPVEHIPLAKTGHNTKGIIVGESGYRFLNPKSCVVINGVIT